LRPMRAIVIASGKDDNGVLLKRPVGETLIARAVRAAKNVRRAATVYAMTDRADYSEQFSALGVLLYCPLDSLGSEPVICIDAHYPLIRPETIERAAEVTNILLCPVQSIAPVTEHPALSLELIDLLEAARKTKSPKHVFTLGPGDASENDAIYWVNVVAFKNGKITGSGWTEFSIPPYQQALARPPQAASGRGNDIADEIMVDVIVEAAGENSRILVFWNTPEGAEEFHAALYRTAAGASGHAKQYTVPGLMHADPVSGCLVNPVSGEKLINRQAMPPLMERSWALIAGPARDVADILSGKKPRILRGISLSKEESTCVKHDLDALRLRRKLMSETAANEIPAIASCESQKP